MIFFFHFSWIFLHLHREMFNIWICMNMNMNQCHWKASDSDYRQSQRFLSTVISEIVLYCFTVYIGQIKVLWRRLHVAFLTHDGVIKWKHLPRYWPFVRGIHRSPVNSTHKGQWRGALMFSLICTWISSWVNSPEAGDLRRHRAHCDVSVMNVYVLTNATWTVTTTLLFGGPGPRWWRLKSHVTRLFPQQLVPTKLKENTKALHHCPTVSSVFSAKGQTVPKSSARFRECEFNGPSKSYFKELYIKFPTATLFSCDLLFKTRMRSVWWEA